MLVHRSAAPTMDPASGPVPMLRAILEGTRQVAQGTTNIFLRLFELSAKGGCKLSGPLRLRVQSRSRTRLRIAASIASLFRACSKGILDTIAPLSRG